MTEVISNSMNPVRTVCACSWGELDIFKTISHAYWLIDHLVFFVASHLL